MLLSPKKKIASLIVSRMKKKPGEKAGDFVQKLDEDSSKEKPVSNEEPESDSSAGLEDAASRMMSALTSKDTKEFAAALEDFIYLCKDESGSSEEAME